MGFGAGKQTANTARSNRDSWLNQFDLDAVKFNIYALINDSKDWWPADFGHHGPF